MKEGRRFHIFSSFCALCAATWWWNKADHSDAIFNSPRRPPASAAWAAAVPTLDIGVRSASRTSREDGWVEGDRGAALAAVATTTTTKSWTPRARQPVSAMRPWPRPTSTGQPRPPRPGGSWSTRRPPPKTKNCKNLKKLQELEQEQFYLWLLSVVRTVTQYISPSRRTNIVPTQK